MPIERIIGAATSLPTGTTRQVSVQRFEVPPRIPAPRGEVEPRAIISSPSRDSPRVQAGRWLGHVAEAQARMERILALAASGRTFSPAELLAMQARVAEASQTVDLAGKVVDRVTSGIRQILQTQV
jgi:hypothetical protein